MFLDYLPTEIITQIFLSLPDISSASALSATSHRFHTIFHSPQNLVILSSTAEAEFGPVDDIIQLVTHNASQPAHIHRKVPLSAALIKQIVHMGRIAQRWEDIYPFKKWRTDFASRRLLTTTERYAVRRAIYRLWLFTKAFHNASNIRTCRSIPSVVSTRTALLQNFPTHELAEMYDVHQVMRDVMRTNVCPSNGRMRVKYQSRYPEQQHGLMVNIHLNYPPAPSSLIPESWFHNSPSANLGSRYNQPSRWLDPGSEGWGDDITHYYVVEDMLKMDPEQILHLKDHCPSKVQVETFIKAVAGEWFANNGETFNETLAAVVRQRGGEMEELSASVEAEEMGVAVE